METNTIIGYLTIGAAAAFLYHYYNRSSKNPVRVTDHKIQPVRKEPKVKKPREKKPPVPMETAPVATTTSYQRIDDSSDDEKINNKEFARQLTLAKTGTKVATKKADDKKIKSVKQSRAQEKIPEIEKPSAPSSTAGIDADDDQSVEPSPRIAPADAGGVADMLEVPAPGPKSIRLTDTMKEDPKPKKVQKAPEPAMTKKQRQNKKKAELRKLEREEAEKERKVKEEAQRRQARISEGRPAQDGTAFTNKATSAWKKVNTNGTSAQTDVAPLDTFEESKIEAKESSNTSTTSDWIKDLPSEEEQIERVRREALEDEWATVETKASKRKQRKKDDPTTTTKSSETTSTRPNGSATKSFTSQSSFAALNTGGDSTEESEESDAKPEQTKNAGSSFTKAPAPKAKAVEVEWEI